MIELLHANTFAPVARLAAVRLRLPAIWHRHDILPYNAPGLAIAKIRDRSVDDGLPGRVTGYSGWLAFLRERVVTRKIKFITTASMLNIPPKPRG
ncbi:hypothetical protein Terro_1678 [Terriglobus roseus DSM 18391]|uniref:Uncharacterized protein n=1 Tax=Terriglobus roseus (strain DSM 18391 / NRRL B-41598 / KBS 63) TaxID=926566 RepID=I3ZFG3_TERRK|nr:hypothetical protein Terro_1678 [Terriglobus roseus DSM 18391]